MKLIQKIGVTRALAWCLGMALASGITLAQSVRAAIRSPAEQAGVSSALSTFATDERGWLERFYAPRAYAPAWNPSSAADALEVLRDATAHGLDPQDYGVDALQRQLDGGAAGSVRFDIALTAAMLRYLADLGAGRVPSEYGVGPADAQPGRRDPVERLRAGLAGGGLRAAVRTAEPQLRQYEWVKAALADYRELAKAPYPALPRPSAGVVAGGAYPGAGALFERLVLLKDLPADAPPPPDGVYSGPMEEGVRRFQARHGLDEDGVLGRGTIEALNVPPGRRVRQLELTLERLRWLPEFGLGPLIVVNLPAYRLWGLHRGSAEAPLEMRVVVGTAFRTETPLFVGQMRYVEFHPYWNVPRSILHNEVLPGLARDARYLAQNGMETVPPGASVADLAADRARVRQRPGPKNALGAIKFAMPNPMDIYLHATPAQALFRRSRRDLSHGCIRVEDPAALALFVLGRQAPWNAEAVRAALQPGPTRRVDLARAIPVVIFYATAIVDNVGRPHFAADIYGRDVKLQQALAARHERIVSATEK